MGRGGRGGEESTLQRRQKVDEGSEAGQDLKGQLLSCAMFILSPGEKNQCLAMRMWPVVVLG